jgi:alkylation response protein AidB-like acyl-CoA dehydrogenase
MAGRGVALAAKPNIGQAGRVGGRISYPHGTPDYFAEFAAQARELGARLIGGCCGTTAAQIAAIATALEEERQATAQIVVHEPSLRPIVAAERGVTRLEEAFTAGDWVISLELDPPTGANQEGMLAIAERCVSMDGVDGGVAGNGVAGNGVDGREVAREYLWSLQYTIAAGTSQIQRNLIAERILGMPKR